MPTAYLLGAGFTRAICTDAPLNNDIMKDLNVPNNPDIVNAYNNTEPNIEEFLSALDLLEMRYDKTDRCKARRLNDDRNLINEQLTQLFCIKISNEAQATNHILLSKFTESVLGCAHILTLNYDLVLDRGLWDSRRWSPIGGYGLSPFPAATNENERLYNIALLKLHGSCNFRVRAAEDRYFEVEITPDLFPGVNTVFNRDIGGPQLVFMSYIKLFSNGLMELWRKAIEYMREADRLIIIGCSVRDEDTFLKYMLYHFGMKPDTNAFHIDIVGKGDTNEIKNKIQSLIACPDKQVICTYDEGLEAYVGSMK